MAVYNILCTCTTIMTEEDVIKMHESKAAKKLPVGFISQDVKKAHCSPPTTLPTPTKEKKQVIKEDVPMGFIAQDVMRQHGH